MMGRKPQKPGKVRLNVRVSSDAMALVAQVQDRYPTIRSTSGFVDAALLAWGWAALTYGLDGHWHPFFPPVQGGSRKRRPLRLLPMKLSDSQHEKPNDET